MDKKWKDVITKTLNVEPYAINSNLFSATNRQRLYWTNIKLNNEIIDKNIHISDILSPTGNEKIINNHLKMIINYRNNLENVIIMEDDIAFNIPPEMLDEKLKLIFNNNLDFDVFHLSYRYRISDDVSGIDYLKKLSYCHYCSCYIINKKCYDEIIDCWEKSLLLLSPENTDLGLEWHQKTQRFSCDISYIPLLRKKNWY
jgi:hypothetical protein